MRSEMVFRAQEQLSNKFALCQATAKVTRRLHFASANTKDAIDDAFATVAASTRFMQVQDLQNPPVERVNGATRLFS